jgi:hypothetical protein
MTAQDKIDTVFLKETVADVVVKACSECAVAQPDDPVGYVAGWLEQFVKNDAILKKRAAEKTAEAEEKAAEIEVRPSAPRDIVPFAFVLARVVPDRVEAETGVGFFTAREDPGRCPIRQSPVALGRLVDRTPEAPRRSYASDREPRTLSPNLHHQAQKEADAKVLNEATRVAKALEHIASLDGDPDILYKHAANYALKLATNGGAGMRAYVADLEEAEEDETLDKDNSEEGEEEDKKESAEDDAEGEADAAEGPAPISYENLFFRYVACAAPKGDDQDWIVGKKLERPDGISFALVDDEPQAPWIDVANVMTYEGKELELPSEPGDPEESEEPKRREKACFLGGVPRAGAYFAAPITLATGEVAGMLCLDTLRTSTGGTGRPIAPEDKALARRVAFAAARAMDAAAAKRAEILAAAEEEQAEIVARIEAAKAPEGGDEGGDKPDGDADAADATPEEPDPELAPEPKDGEDEGDAERRVALVTAKNQLGPAEALVARNQKIFETVRDLIDLVDDAALAEMRSLPRAPKATWRVIKAGLYATGHKRFEFETWALTRKQIGPNYNDELKALDPMDTERNEKAWDGVDRCLKGITDSAVLKESKVGALLFRWFNAFKELSDAAVNVKKIKEEIDRCEEAIEKAAEAKAEAEADAAAAAAAGETGDTPEADE